MKKFYLAPNGFKHPRAYKKIILSMDPLSSLNWKKEKEMAHNYVREGFSILWELNLGLFEHLPGTLDDESQFLTLQLGLRHFRENVFPEFEKETIGAILYRGKCDLSEESLEYLLFLLPELPETVDPFLAFDSYTSETIFRFISQISSEHFYVMLQDEFPYETEKMTTALLLPALDEGWEELSACQDLGEMPFRVIPEHLLTQEWEGIERLIVTSKGVSAQGKRKVSGFLASGGEVLSLFEAVQMA